LNATSSSRRRIRAQAVRTNSGKIAERRMVVSPGTLAPPEKPVWTKGSPFRGLEPFDFEHAPIFFGRTGAVSTAIEALRKTQADKDDPRSFLLVLGASGSGKSSLARAGVLPVLTEPGVIEGTGLWRRAIMKPSDAGGDVLLGLANALLAESALPELTSHGTTPYSLEANYAAIPEEIRSGLRVASEREQARQRSDIEALVRRRSGTRFSRCSPRFPGAIQSRLLSRCGATFSRDWPSFLNF
jgi:Novel STAND NTPase 1